tara:strand:+ start:285 stop:662 length:378 start_codon:yes stop_codon:yes gene_type:complete
MNFAGNAIGFLKKFGEGIGNFFLGDPTDKEGNVNPLDKRYEGPGFQGLPEHQQQKEYESLRNKGPQAFLFDFLGNNDEIAGVPRFIQSSPPPNVINKAPHIDSRYMDRMLEERNKMMGVQLPPFV